MTGFRLVSDSLHGAVIGRGVYFGDFTDQQAYNLAGSDSPEGVHVAEQGVGQVSSSANGQDAGDVGTGVQGALRIGGFAVTDIQNTNNRRNNTGQSQQERISYTFAAFERNRTQSQSRDDSAYIRFKQVSAHTGYVAYVIAYVIGDGSRVTGIVFRNTGFHLTYQVSAYVGSFGVDTAANTGKQCDGTCAQTETGYDIHVRTVFAKQSKSQRYTGDAQANHAQTHYGTAGESNLQCLGHAVFSSRRGTNVSFGGNIHAAVTGQNGENCAGNEADCCHGSQENTDNNCNNQNEYSQCFVFTVQERHSTFVNVPGNFLHQFIAGFRFHDGTAQHGSDQKREDTGANG